MTPIANPIHREVAQKHVATLTLSLFAIHGYPTPGNDVVGRIVETALGSVSLRELRSPESLSSSAIGAIDQLVRNTQEANKPVNKFSAEGARAELAVGGAAMKFADAAERSDAIRLSSQRRDATASNSSGATSDRAASGARFDGMGNAQWATEKGLAITRAFAVSNDMIWATKQPDLLRMGRPALQALHETHLKGDGYEQLHGRAHLNFDNRTIVAGAAYMRRNHLNYNDAARASGAVDALKELTAAQRAKHAEAVKGVYRSEAGKSQNDANKRLYDSGEDMIKSNPGNKHVSSKVEAERKAYGIQKGVEHRAEVKAEEKKTAAIEHDVKADGKQMVAQKAEAKNNDASAKMAEMLLKRRQAAAAAPKAAH